jgi:hypothetical protein
MMACWNAHQAIAQLLINERADVDAVDNVRITGYSAYRNYLTITIIIVQITTTTTIDNNSEKPRRTICSRYHGFTRSAGITAQESAQPRQLSAAFAKCSHVRSNFNNPQGPRCCSQVRHWVEIRRGTSHQGRTARERNCWQDNIGVGFEEARRERASIACIIAYIIAYMVCISNTTYARLARYQSNRRHRHRRRAQEVGPSDSLYIL